MSLKIEWTPSPTTGESHHCRRCRRKRNTDQWQDTKNMRNMMAARQARAKHPGLAKNGELNDQSSSF
jgi:hypothetical protein